MLSAFLDSFSGCAGWRSSSSWVVLARDAATRHLPWQTHNDPRTSTAGLAVETDAGTGCDYIVTPWGGIMPRTGSDGKQVCHPKT